jgi:prevent-host-death family protein
LYEIPSAERAISTVALSWHGATVNKPVGENPLGSPGAFVCRNFSMQEEAAIAMDRLLGSNTSASNRLAILVRIDQTGHMKMVSLSEAKANLSRHIERVRHGESVCIQVRGVPVAELVPVEGGKSGEAESGELQELERAGLVRRGRGALPEAIFMPGPAARGKGVMSALLDERRAGR